MVCPDSRAKCKLSVFEISGEKKLIVTEMKPTRTEFISLAYSSTKIDSVVLLMINEICEPVPISVTMSCSDWVF